MELPQEDKTNVQMRSGVGERRRWWRRYDPSSDSRERKQGVKSVDVLYNDKLTIGELNVCSRQPPNYKLR